MQPDNANGLEDIAVTSRSMRLLSGSNKVRGNVCSWCTYGSQMRQRSIRGCGALAFIVMAKWYSSVVQMFEHRGTEGLEKAARGS